MNEISNITIIDNSSTSLLTAQETQSVNLLNNINQQIEVITDEVVVNFVDVGIQGPPGKSGKDGKSIQYQWSNTRLGIRAEGDTSFTFVDLKGSKGDKGDTGNNLTFETLTEPQKQELRADVGNTSVNYTNIFLNTLLN